MALIIVAVLPLLWSCTNTEESPATQGENDVDAARLFIRSALDGRWKDAKRLVVQDSLNIQDIETAQRVADRWDVTTQRGYRESQIRIHNTKKVNDSVTIITYSNTYKNQQDSIKVINVGGQWLVDLKYSFHRNNSLQP